MIHKNEFVEFLLNSKVLKFGDFTTKSGRQTPFFINTGEYKTGAQISALSRYYAQAVEEHFKGDITNLYGPAYKGISLAVSTAQTLFQTHNLDLSYTFNRKEAKTHGEKGVLIGNQYNSPEDVLIIEDVITAGTSVKESMKMLNQIANANVKGLLVSVDRKEKLDNGLSALKWVEEEFGIQAHSIISIEDIIAFISDAANRKKFELPENLLERIEQYREKYGAN